MQKYILLSFGFFCLALGLIGAFLPILPTTPFLILAALCFSKSSKRMHDWLLAMPYFGDGLQHWENHGAIRSKAKVLSSTMITILFSLTLIFVKVAYWIKAVLVLIGIAVIAFIWTRPTE